MKRSLSFEMKVMKSLLMQCPQIGRTFLTRTLKSTADGLMMTSSMTTRLSLLLPQSNTRTAGFF
jgi:hypothetical protein